MWPCDFANGETKFQKVKGFIQEYMGDNEETGAWPINVLTQPDGL